MSSAISSSPSTVESSGGACPKVALGVKKAVEGEVGGGNGDVEELVPGPGAGPFFSCTLFAVIFSSLTVKVLVMELERGRGRESVVFAPDFEF